MNRKFLKTLLALLLSCIPAAAAQKAKAIARLSGLDGKPAGTAEFAALNHGVLVTFDLQGLSPGAHAIHLHTSGNCDAKAPSPRPARS